MAEILFFLIPVNRKNTGPSRSVSAVPAVDTKTVESVCFKTLGRSIGIAITAEDGAGEVRAQPLHGAARRTRAHARRRRSCTGGRTPPWARADCGGGGCDGERRRGAQRWR
jgi:hypothetical protein